MNRLMIAMILGLSLLAGSPSFAGDGYHHGGPGHNIEKMKKQLGLNDNQAKEISAIMKETHEKMQALREDSHKRIKALLNENQQQKFEDFHEKRKAKMEKMKEKIEKHKEKKKQKRAEKEG